VVELSHFPSVRKIFFKPLITFHKATITLSSGLNWNESMLPLENGAPSLTRLRHYVGCELKPHGMIQPALLKKFRREISLFPKTFCGGWRPSKEFEERIANFRK